jgi:hypothetical protein
MPKDRSSITCAVKGNAIAPISKSATQTDGKIQRVLRKSSSIEASSRIFRAPVPIFVHLLGRCGERRQATPFSFATLLGMRTVGENNHRVQPQLSSLPWRGAWARVDQPGAAYLQYSAGSLEEVVHAALEEVAAEAAEAAVGRSSRQHRAGKQLRADGG